MDRKPVSSQGQSRSNFPSRPLSRNSRKVKSLDTRASSSAPARENSSGSHITSQKDGSHLQMTGNHHSAHVQQGRDVEAEEQDDDVEMEEAGGDPMPIVVSDILRPSNNHTRGPGRPPNPAPSRQTHIRQYLTSSSRPPSSPSTTRLAVHIRSSPVTPLTTTFTPEPAPEGSSTNTMVGLSNFRLRPGTPRRSVDGGGGGGSGSGSGRGRGRGRTPTAPAAGPAAAGSSSTGDPPRRKRGRPKGWRRSPNADITAAAFTAALGREVRRAAAAAAAAEGRSAGATTTTTNTTTGMKREVRGATAVQAGAPPAASSDMANAKRGRGRPPKPPSPTPRECYLRSRPAYAPYACDWDAGLPTACPAELQNLETLRRHVLLVHGEYGGQNDEDVVIVCRYAGCCRASPAGAAGAATAAAATATATNRFASYDEWAAHVEDRHMAWYQWHRGAGVQNSGSEAPRLLPPPMMGQAAHAHGKGQGLQGLRDANADADDTDDAAMPPLPSYLFDARGNQITPSVRDQRLETAEEERERKRGLRRLLIEQNDNAISEDEFRRQTLGIE
ncbi:hypothetical protein GGR56DRAFT_690383 [Xylariaceae sp. FL0804]|nr:hypothetical protein GGR56DRAFT_690383 [Xylariaceae sp. FL0804]